MLRNAESLNFEKLNEFDSFSKIYRSDIIAITEVHAQNTYMLKMNNFSQFIKLRPETRPLGKKGITDNDIPCNKSGTVQIDGE